MSTHAKAIAIGCSIGPLLALAWFFLLVDRTGNEGTASITLTEDRVDVDLPSPSLTSEDVVRLQLQALQAAATDPEAIVDCYSFASPSNREMTGPLSRFDALVRSGDYGILIGHRQAVLGRATLLESIDPQADPATMILATVVGQDGQSRSFQFVLQRQDEPPYEDCWMTIAVFPVALNDATAAGDVADAVAVPPADARGIDE